MSTVNIRRDVKDAFYRYKMPKLLSKIEGKGNGIKTVIPNMVEISKALNRPPSYVTKFFGSELGAQVICDEKNARYIVNGAHEAERLSSVLDLFIQKFVLCPGCENPETALIITKDEKVIRSCKACGQRNPVDMLHRLTIYILKNPSANKEAVKEEAKEEPAEPTSLMNSLSLSKDFELDENDDGDDPLEEFANFLTDNPSADYKEIMEFGEDLGIKADKAVAIIVQILFSEDILSEIPKRKQLLLGYTQNNDRAQRATLGGLERLIGITFPSLEKNITAIFMALYNEDLVEEEAFLKWSERVSKKFVDKEIGKKIRKLAEPFITWLKEADEEDDDE